jgi:hypothetical protein
MSRDVETYVQACDLCVQTKASRLAPQGFLQPLPVPYKAWSDMSVDYITPLPESNWYGRSYKHLLIVVCRLTKMRHLIPVSRLTAAGLADAFVTRDQTKEVSTKQCCSVPSYRWGQGQVIYRVAECQGTLV